MSWKHWKISPFDRLKGQDLGLTSLDQDCKRKAAIWWEAPDGEAAVPLADARVFATLFRPSQGGVPFLWGAMWGLRLAGGVVETVAKGEIKILSMVDRRCPRCYRGGAVDPRIILRNGRCGVCGTQSGYLETAFKPYGVYMPAPRFGGRVQVVEGSLWADISDGLKEKLLQDKTKVTAMPVPRRLLTRVKSASGGFLLKDEVDATVLDFLSGMPLAAGESPAAGVVKEITLVEGTRQLVLVADGGREHVIRWNTGWIPQVIDGQRVALGDELAVPVERERFTVPDAVDPTAFLEGLTDDQKRYLRIHVGYAHVLDRQHGRIDDRTLARQVDAGERLYPLAWVRPDCSVGALLDMTGLPVGRAVTVASAALKGRTDVFSWDLSRHEHVDEYMSTRGRRQQPQQQPKVERAEPRVVSEIVGIPVTQVPEVPTAVPVTVVPEDTVVPVAAVLTPEVEEVIVDSHDDTASSGTGNHHLDLQQGTDGGDRGLSGDQAIDLSQVRIGAGSGLCSAQPQGTSPS